MRKTIIASTFLIIGYVVVSSASCGSGTGEGSEGGLDGLAGGSSGSGSGGSKGSSSGGTDGTGSGGSAGSATGGTSGSSSGGTSGSASGGTSGEGSGGSTGSASGGSKGSSSGGSKGSSSGGSKGSSSGGSKGSSSGGTKGSSSGGTKGSSSGGTKGSSSGGTKGSSSGGSKGSKGSGSGGTKGKGDGGGDTGYAFYESPKLDRRHAITLASGGSETIPFAWHDSTGLAPPSDLAIEAGGKPVLQVFTVGSHPFVRAGLDVAPIDPGAQYNVVLSRVNDQVSVTLVRGSDDVILRTQAHVADDRTAANVVLPSASWRSSLVTKY